MNPESPYAALQIPDYRLFISARFFVTLAIQIQSVVVTWQVYELTKDPFALGLTGLAEAIPSISVSLYAGYLADVVERKKILVVCLATLLACSISLLFFTQGGKHFIETYSAFPIYAVIFISGIARGFLNPAIFAFMPQLVPRELYKNAISWNSALWETASLSGPPLGSLIYAFSNVSVAYLVDVVLMAIGVALAIMIKRKALPPSDEDEGVITKIRAGLRFVFGHKIVLSAISLDLFAVLFGGAVGMLPFFADTILQVGKIGVGFLRAAPGVGALLMAVYITHHPIQSGIGKKLLLCVAGFGVCMILFALSTNFWISMFLLMMSGVFDCVSVIIRGTLLQTLTPENMKGRVSAVNHIFVGSSNEIGTFESGTAARLLGLVPSVIFGGCMTLVTVGITGWLSKSLRSLQRVH